MIRVPPLVLGREHKGVPQRLLGHPAAAIEGIDILRDDWLYPIAVLRDSALAHNGAWMRAFAAQTGALLCPHGKTTMSPELFARQAADGVWGMTAATAHHVRLYRGWGVRRIFIANQITGAGNIAYVLDALVEDPELDLYALADSEAGVAALAQAMAARGIVRPLQLLVEIGAPGGRTGVRSHAEGLAVARAIAAAPGLSLVGVEAFEGIFQSGTAEPPPVDAMLDRLVALAKDCADEALFDTDAPILSAGGSGFFDRCAERLATAGLAGARIVLRSGCYIAHDHGLYSRLVTAMRGRGSALPEGEPEPALQVIAAIQSAPEPGRVIAALGKRDVGSDVEPPRPLWWFRPGIHDAPQPMPPGHAVTALYDQHALLDGSPLLAVGDLVGFGVSHPCTTFDRWRLIVTVDGDWRATGAVTTWF